MSNVRSMWSDKIKPTTQSPYTILNAQAVALSQMTSGVLSGVLTEADASDKDRVTYHLDIHAPAVDYTHRVLSATHSRRLLYPASIDADIFRPKGLSGINFNPFGEAMKILNDPEHKPDNRADSDDEFAALVGRVLTSGKVVSLAQSLVALSNETEERRRAKSSAAKSQGRYVAYLSGLDDAARDRELTPVMDVMHDALLKLKGVAAGIPGFDPSIWDVDESETATAWYGEEACHLPVTWRITETPDADEVGAARTASVFTEIVIANDGDVVYRVHSVQVNSPEVEAPPPDGE